MNWNAVIAIAVFVGVCFLPLVLATVIHGGRRRAEGDAQAQDHYWGREHL